MKRHNVCKRHIAIGTDVKLVSYHFPPRYFNGIELVTAFKCIFEETMPKLSVNFGNHISQDSHKNQYPGSVCNFGFTASQYSDRCWSNLPLKCHIFLTLTEVTGSPARSSNSCSGWFVWTSYQVLAWKHNNMTSSLYHQRISSDNRFAHIVWWMFVHMLTYVIVLKLRISFIGSAAKIMQTSLLWWRQMDYSVLLRHIVKSCCP